MERFPKKAHWPRTRSGDL